MIKNPQIGIDRRIRLEWLEQTVILLQTGLPEAEISMALLKKVSGSLSVGKSAVKRGSGEKAVTNLMKIWVRVAPSLRPLRDAGLKLFETTPQQFHIALHWGMMIAVYPFWESVASQTGRLLNLQSTISPSQIQRRIKEKYGERPTVKDATRRVLRSMNDWGVLTDSSKKGIYQIGDSLSISDTIVIAWLIEAQLHAYPENKAPLGTLIDAPSLFPFLLSPLSGEMLMIGSPRLEVIRHGLDNDLVILKN